MRRTFFCLQLIILILGNFSILAQNLVPDPSFEYYYTCPQGGNLLNDTTIDNVTVGASKNWYSPNQEYCVIYNTCDNPSNIPLNSLGLGYQYPSSGNGYLLMACWVNARTVNGGGENYKSYAQTKLTNTLKQNHFYQVSFNLNLPGYTNCKVFTTDAFGINFSSKREVDYSTGGNLPLSYSVRNHVSQYITDTLGWTKICGIYKAKGGERFLTLGNFDNDSVMYATMQLFQNYNFPGCIDTGIFFFVDDVSVEDLNIHNPFNDTIVCNSAQFNKILTAYPNAQSYLWSTGDTTPTITVHQHGTYWVTMQVGCGIVTDSIYILTQQTPQFNIADTSLCETPNLIIQSPIVASQYLWSNSNNKPQTLINSFGVYWLRLTDFCGASFTDTFKVLQKAVPINPFSLGADTAICPNEYITLKAPNTNNLYLWSTNQTTQSIKINQEGTYHCAIINPCFSFSDTIQITTRNCEIILPNAFTPNSDGLNDEFRIIRPEFPILNLSIFNRWGQKVFSYDGASFGWDGKYKTVECPIGTYYYLCTYKNGRDIKTIKGSVELVR